MGRCLVDSVYNLLSGLANVRVRSNIALVRALATCVAACFVTEMVVHVSSSSVDHVASNNDDREGRDLEQPSRGRIRQTSDAVPDAAFAVVTVPPDLERDRFFPRRHHEVGRSGTRPFISC